MPSPVDIDALAIPEGASGFRKQLVAEVDALLREHHSQLARHVEKVVGEHQAQLLQWQRGSLRPLANSAVDKIQKQIPRGAGRGSIRLSRQSAQVASQDLGGGASSHPAGEAERAKSALRRDHELPDGKRPTESRASGDPSGASVAGLNVDSASVAPKVANRTTMRTTFQCSMRLSEMQKPIVSYREELKARWQRAISKSVFSSIGEAPGSRSDARGVCAGVRSIVDSAGFEIFTCVVIVTNAIFFGTETQFIAMGIKPAAFDYIAFAFTAVFAGELILRLVAAGRKFYANEHRVWNAIDTAVVFMSLLEAGFRAHDSDGSANLTYVRLIRVARIVRIFQVVRVFQVFAPLRILLYCVLNTLRSLIWTMVLLVAILYVFGILFTQASLEVLSEGRDHLTDPTEQQHFDALEQHFGGLQWAVFTLFKAVTGGVTWQEVSAPLSFVHPFWEFLFTVFISFTYFAVLNVVTGVFCQSAIESAAKDQDMVVQAQLIDKKVYTEQLMELFHRIDTSNCGHVDFIMLESCLKDPQSRAYFEALGITSDDAWNLFMLLDDDDSDQIDLEEFVSGCLRLRGASRSIDSHMLLHESRWIMKKIGSLSKAFNTLLLQLSSPDCQEPIDGSRPLEMSQSIPVSWRLGQSMPVPGPLGQCEQSARESGHQQGILDGTRSPVARVSTRI